MEERGEGMVWMASKGTKWKAGLADKEVNVYIFITL